MNEQEVNKTMMDERDVFPRLRILKNLFVLSLTFLLTCTSIDGLSMLQSTLNRDQGIGVVSTAVQFATGCLTAMLFMKYLIIKFGSKSVLATCILVHIPSILANFYPHWFTMIPAYTLLGIAATLLWGSNSAYLANLSQLYALITSESNLSKCLESGVIYKTKTNKNIKNGRYEDVVDGHFRSYSNIDSIFLQSAKNKNSDLVEKYVTPGNFGRNHVKSKSFSSAQSHSVQEVNTSIANSLADNNAKNCIYNAIFKVNSSTKAQSVEEQLSDETMNLKTKTDEYEALSVNSKNKYFIENKDAFLPEEDDFRSDKLEHKSSSSFTASDKEIYSEIIDSTAARFFGFHSMFYNSGHIWSNLISFFILQQGVIDDSYIHDSSCNCGADFCNVETNCFESNLKEPPAEVKYLLLSIFLSLNIVALLLVMFFLDSLEKKENSVHFSLNLAFATLTQLKKPFQLLLVPLSIYMGMAQGFFYADFSKAFVGCSWGMHHIGLVTIAFGISSSLLSSLSGWLVKHLGRMTIFLGAFLMNVAVNVLMLIWIPDSNDPVIFYVIATMWGFVLGSCWSQLKAFYGVLFKSNEEAAFGCYELSHSVGACISFACSNYLCAYIKIYMMIFVSTLGMTGYLVVEKYHDKNR